MIDSKTMMQQHTYNEVKLKVLNESVVSCKAVMQKRIKRLALKRVAKAIKVT